MNMCAKCHGNLSDSLKDIEKTNVNLIMAQEEEVRNQKSQSPAKSVTIWEP